MTDEETVVCPACQGTGKSSRGGSCFPCQGRGKVPGDPAAISAPRQAALDALAERGVVSATPAQESATEVPPDARMMQLLVEHWTPDSEEWPVVSAVREVLGSIDCDPASCVQAQEVIKADIWYGPGSPAGEDGLTEPWGGRVYLNPPGGVVPDAYRGMGSDSSSALWWTRLADSWKSGETEAAIFMGFTLEILRNAQGFEESLQPLDFPLCFPRARIPHDTDNRLYEKGAKKGKLINPALPLGARVAQTSPTHAQVIVYLPPVTEEIRKMMPLKGGGWGEAAARVHDFERVFSRFGRCKL